MSKAEKFDKFLEENKITCFSKEEVKNDLHTVVYRAHMEVSGQMLPTMVVADNGDICLDSCLTDTEESFDPRLVHTVIDVILRHLTEEYPNLMSLVWAK